MSRTFLRRIATVSLLALAGTALPLDAAAAIDPGDIPSKVLPPGGWKDTQWVDPGGFTTVNVNSFGLAANDPTVDASRAVQTYLATATGRVVLTFQPGVYYFHSALTITRSNVILRGAGSGSTSFVIGSKDARDAEIRFTGSESGGELAVSGAVASGVRQLTLADASTIAVGDVIQLMAKSGLVAFGYEVESQFFTVTARSGNTVTLDMPVGLDYPTSKQPVVQRINAIRNVGIDNVLLTRYVQPLGETVDNLEFDYAYNAFAKNLESVMGHRAHIAVYWSKDVVIAGNKVHDAFKGNTGDYSFGYGISINWGSTGVRVTDNKVWDLRHMIILQLGCNYTVVSYNSLETPFTDYNDMALHANYAYMNLFEGNRFKEGYADNSKTGSQNATGPGNTWFRNYANEEIGSINSATTRQNIIGNVVGSLVTSGSSHVIGANRVAGANQWESLPANAELPPSLYLDAAPGFWPSGTAWPVWGPDQASGGTSRTIPAQNKSKPTTRVYTDPLNDWSGTHYYSSTLTFGTSSDSNFSGDASRVTRTTTGSAEVIWHVPDLVSAYVTVYFWPNAALAPFTFQTSANEGATWQSAAPLIDTDGGNWVKYTYLITGGGTADYLKVVFPAISPEYAAQISSVQFTVR